METMKRRKRKGIFTGILRTCTKCKKEKDTGEFNKDKQKKDGLCLWCVDCRIASQKSYYTRHASEIKETVQEWREADSKRNKESYRNSRYNLDPGQYDSMLENQGNACPVCTLEFSEDNKPHVDHDHACCSGSMTCGKCVRGLLCHKCNKALGFFADNVESLQRAIQYLRRV